LRSAARTKAVETSLLIFSPGGIEELFFELGTADPDQAIDNDDALAAVRQYGWEFLGPIPPAAG
jgi:hypothetical protein